MLSTKLKPAVMRKHPGFLRKSVILLYENARLHKSQLTREPISKFSLPHTQYSPDLAPNDFYLLGPFKEALRVTKFYDNYEVK